jgi:uncharacterized protein
VRHPQEFGIYGFWIADSLAAELLLANSVDAGNHRVAHFRRDPGGRRQLALFAGGRDPSEGDGLPAPLFPENLPEGAEYDKLISRVKANEIIRGNCCPRTASSH